MHNLYLEIEYQNADIERLQHAWQHLIAKHDILQSIRNAQHLSKVADTTYPIKLYNLSLQADSKIKQVQDKLRENGLTQSLDSAQWPWFSLNATCYDSGNIRFYLSVANDMLDGEQLHYLLREWLALYQHPTLPLQSVPLTAPTAKTKTTRNAISLRYQHLLGRLEHTTLNGLREQSLQHHVSMPVVTLNAFTDELVRQQFDYPVKMTLANRYAFYPYMYDKAGFATSVANLPIKDVQQGSFAERCQNTDTQLRQESLQSEQGLSAEHLHFNERDNKYALFTCSLDQDLPAGPMFAKLPDIIYCNISMPQVMVDYSVWEQGGQLMYRWSYAKALPAVNTDMDKSLLRQAVADNPELLDILHDDESAKKKKLGALKAAGIVIAGGGAGAAHANSKKKIKGATVPLDMIKTPHETNNIMNNAFNHNGQALLALSNSSNAVWQESRAETPEQQSNDPAPEEKTRFQENLNKMPSGAAAGLLAGTIGALKEIDLRPTPQVEGPVPADLDNMSEDEIDAAYEDFSDRVMQVHAAPSKADLLQGDACAQFTGMAAEMGPDVGLMQDDLMAMGKGLDTVAADLAKGDVKSAAAGIDTLSGDHVNLVNKMEENDLLKSAYDNPLTQSASSVLDAVENLDANLDDKSGLNKLDNSIDGLDAQIKDYQETTSPAAVMSMAADKMQLDKAMDEIKNNPQVAAAQEKAETLKALAEEYSKYDCKTLVEKHAREQIAKLREKAKELEQQIPPPPENPVAGQIDEMKAQAADVKARAAALKEMKPELAIQDPGLQDSLNKLDAQADNLAKTVQGQCPICSASDPNLPSIPNCGHNHFDVMSMTNPFHMPMLSIMATIQALMKLPPPLDSLVGDRISKLKGMYNKLNAMNPLRNVKDYYDLVAGVASGNPYQAMLGITKLVKNKLIAQAKKLANCPNYVEVARGQIESLKSQALNAQKSVEQAQEKLKGHVEGGKDVDMNEKWNGLKAGMKDSMYKNKDKLENKAQQEFQKNLSKAQAKAMEKAMASCECWKNANLPNLEKAKPDQVLVTGFMLKCPQGAGPPAKMMIPPSGTKINNKDALTVTPAPLMASMGICNQLSKGPVQVPCTMAIMKIGGAMSSSTMGFPLATKDKTQFMCGVGMKLNVMDTGQNPKEPTTTS